MSDTFGLKLGIEGEKEFKSALKDINSTFKVLGSELTLVTSQFDKQDKSVEAVSARNKVLNKEIEEQQKKIALLASALENASKSFGENDKRTQNWQVQLNEAKATLNKLDKELENNEKSLDDTAKGFDNAEKEADDFGQEVKKAGKEAKSSSEKIEKLGEIAKGLGVVLSAAVAAIGVAVSKTVGMVDDCVDVYADFDDSMRQVAATMGLSSEEISKGGGDFDKLSQAAKDAGASTRYTASQAAEALNYLALAGYDAKKSIEVMPKVLDLAAAGGLDLAYASDLVTDSMSALGLSSKDLDKFMDQMARTSQKSNTSVQQLGEAILVCAGTASMTGQDLDNINTALGVMADNGIKGAEGGTHLRNVLLALSSPTDKGAKQLKKLGVEVFDAKGNMKQLDVVLTDLEKSMAKMSQEEKTAAIKSIFNKTDIAAVNTLLSSTSGRFKELNGLVLDSAGAAKEMANTMESGLAGTERSWKSALEGLQIETGEIFSNIKKNALTDLTEVVRGLTKGIAESEGDWSKIGDSIGAAIEGILSKLNAYLPTVVDMAVGIISALTEGLASNTQSVVSAASKILDSLISGINTALPKLMTVAVPLLLSLADGLTSNLPIIVQTALQVVLMLANGIASAAPTLIPQIVQTVITIAETLISNVDVLVRAVLDICIAVGEGIASALPLLVAEIPRLISSIVTEINASLPLLLPAAIEIVMSLASGILQALPEFIAIVPNLILGLIQGFTENLPTLILYAPSILAAIGEGLIQAIPDLLLVIPRVIISVVDTFKAYDWKSIGTSIMTGLKNGVSDMIESLKDKVKSVGQSIIETFCNLFGIHSPSTVFAGFGRNLLEGLWNGIQNVKSWLIDKIRGLGSAITDAMKAVLGIHSPSSVFRDQIGKNLALGVGVGFAETMNRVKEDMANAVLTDFDISTDVNSTFSGSPGTAREISLTLHIENFYNNTAQDIRQLAEEISTILASQVSRKAEAF